MRFYQSFHHFSCCPVVRPPDRSPHFTETDMDMRPVPIPGAFQVGRFSILLAGAILVCQAPPKWIRGGGTGGDRRAFISPLSPARDAVLSHRDCSETSRRSSVLGPPKFRVLIPTGTLILHSFCGAGAMSREPLWTCKFRALFPQSSRRDPVYMNKGAIFRWVIFGIHLRCSRLADPTGLVAAKPDSASALPKQEKTRRRMSRRSVRLPAN